MQFLLPKAAREPGMSLLQEGPCAQCHERHHLAVRNRRAARPKAFDSGRGTQSSLAVKQGKDYRERAQGTGKLADMHILKVWSRDLKTSR